MYLFLRLNAPLCRVLCPAGVPPGCYEVAWLVDVRKQLEVVYVLPPEAPSLHDAPLCCMLCLMLWLDCAALNFDDDDDDMLCLQVCHLAAMRWFGWWM
jgi:hypothetical protein